MPEHPWPTPKVISCDVFANPGPDANSIWAPAVAARREIAAPTKHACDVRLMDEASSERFVYRAMRARTMRSFVARELRDSIDRTPRARLSRNGPQNLGASSRAERGRVRGAHGVRVAARRARSDGSAYRCGWHFGR